MKRLSILFCSVLFVCAGCQRKQVEPQVAFAEMSFDDQHAQLTANMETAKQNLTDKGEYTCCTLPTCNWCLVYDKHCSCANHLVEGEPVCPECGHFWKVGRGNIPGIDPADVKSGEHGHEDEAGEHEHEMEE